MAMVHDESVGLCGDNLARVFPFHLVVDAAAAIVQVGPSLAKLLPDLRPGDPLSKWLRVQRPQNARLREVAGRAHAGVTVGTPDGRLRLLYQVVEQGSDLLLVGSPQLNDAAEFNELGLRLDAFAPHDALPNNVLVMQPKNRLIREVRDLAARLERKHEQLEEANALLEQRVAERTRELQNATDAAERANRAKSQFLTSMSHELRTPLNAIIGLSQMIAEGTLDREQSECVTRVQTSAELLVGIISDILDLSKLEAGRLQLEDVPFRFADCVDEVLAIMAPTADDRGLGLGAELDQAVRSCWLRGDPLRLRQILLNLVNNAVKFTRDGRVDVRASLSEGAAGPRLEVVVSDTGIGIPADKQTSVFRSFEQADGSTTRKYGGTGLGLSICERLTRTMGGTIGVRSEVGRGSEFWFSLPARRCDAPNSTGEREEDGAFGCLLVGRHVLVAEDNPVNQRVVELVLRKMGATYTVVDDGRAAVEAAAQRTFDLILMDVQMPEMDGLEATRRIRQRDREVPIVALTANALHGHDALCHEAGMTAYVTKPVRLAELRRTIARHVAPPADATR